MCHRDLLLRTYHRLNTLRQACGLYGPKLAPNFNAISLFSPDELRLSQLLKELLSPTGSHAQGSIFLELFLQRFGLEIFLPLVDRAKVSTEKTINHNNTVRRIDIYLNFDLAATIAIENKPWAGDQENQCRDYKDYLEQLIHIHPEGLICLIYLSGSGEQPSTFSITEAYRVQAENAGRFKTIGYPQLIDWLKDCRRECQADRVSFFLNEFIDYIQKHFVGIEMAEMQQVVNFALENYNTLEAALEIANAQSEIKKRLLSRLELGLTQILPEGWTLNWDMNNKHRCIWIRHPQAVAYGVLFEFSTLRLSGFSYGICKNNKALPNLPDVRDCLNQNIGITPGTSNWRPWYLDFRARYADWSTSIQPWLDIQSDEQIMANMIMEKTQAIYKALGDANLLGKLA
ncbi:MAG: PD-(D/E)XK nuclease family protein [Proteobacteria bacterium]|nr:PD-(D/E)XK nuclease family protein [Pseudomonadota bacterium]